MTCLEKEKELPRGSGVVVGLCISIPIWIVIIAAGLCIRYLIT